MGYHLTIDLSFTELVALDAALQHELQRLSDDRIRYSDHDDIVGMTLRDTRAINKLIDALDQIITAK